LSENADHHNVPAAAAAAAAAAAGDNSTVDGSQPHAERSEAQVIKSCYAYTRLSNRHQPLR